MSFQPPPEPPTPIEAGLTLAGVAGQLGSPYSALPLEQRTRHLELLSRIERLRDVAFEVVPGRDEWVVTVCAADQVGVLSLLAGLLTAHGLDVREADAYTLVARAPETAIATRPGVRRGAGRMVRPSRAEVRPSRFLLDVFRVRAPEGFGERDWTRLEQELRALVQLVAAGDLDAAREQVIEGVAAHARARRDHEPLYPVDVTIEDDPGTALTRLTIRSRDTEGFLFELTGGLAALEVNIARAEIRTVDSETRDTFWLTDARGHPLTDPRRVEELRVAVALIKEFTHLLPDSPQPAQALRQFSDLVRSVAARPEGGRALDELGAPEVLRTLTELLGVSQFLWEDFLRMQHENLFPVLADVPALEQRKPPERLLAEAREAVAPLDGDDGRAAAGRLNAYKDREMFRIDLRHITRRIGFLAFARELADLADAVVTAAAELALRTVEAGHGIARTADGARSGWAIFALGKLGGREMGFASDVELLFVHGGDARSDGPAPLDAQPYYEAAVREVREAIVTRQEGIFELDLRLRPYGAKGAIASSVEAFRRYYSPEGDAQQFERLALVRLRPVCGDAAILARVLELRDAWVYSGVPLDLDDLLHLRGRQASELARGGTANAKYSRGGVVDLEYFVQALQVEWGARDAAVRAPGTLEGAELLARRGYLPEMTAARVQDAYTFMRRLIDALRVVRGNARDLTLPPSDTRAFEYLARRMYYESPEVLRDAIEVRMRFGQQLWDAFRRLRPGSAPL